MKKEQKIIAIKARIIQQYQSIFIEIDRAEHDIAYIIEQCAMRIASKVTGIKFIKINDREFTIELEIKDDPRKTKHTFNTGFIKPIVCHTIDND